MGLTQVNTSSHPGSELLDGSEHMYDHLNVGQNEHVYLYILHNIILYLYYIIILCYII